MAYVLSFLLVALSVPPAAADANQNLKQEIEKGPLSIRGKFQQT
jgi:hypothetical protein